MPYSNASEAPSYVPKAKRKQWISVWNSAYSRAKKDGKSDKEAEASAFRQANGVAGPGATKKFAKLMAKSIADDAAAFAQSIIEQIQKDFATLPTQIHAPLESAILSGVGQGMLQIDVSNASLLAEVNTIARDYATHRAAEMVGMTHDTEGNLIPNPNAEWAISELTRERIREIITEAFSEDTPIAEIRDEIEQTLEEEAQDGIFSPARAELIARTEIKNAQARGNYAVWEESGVVKTVQWLTSEDEDVCVVCEDNDGVSVEIGKPFPSGDLYPGAHPRCRCVIVVNELK